MTANVLTFAAPAAIRIATNVYARILIVGFALVPAFLVAYLYFYQDPTFKFEDHLFHEFAIAVATLEGLFVAYVTWQCYRTSREPLLRWLTLGFLSFVTIYVLHGAFTGFAHTHIFLFLLYGPASRVAMAILLFVGLLSYGRPPDAPSEYSTPRDWLRWIVLFVLLDVAVAIIALSPIGGHPAVRLTMEGGALVFSAVNVAVMLSRRIRSPLMVVFGIAVTSFAISSAAFILAAPWNHMWWLAHAIFAMGFFVLSYGIVEAFRTTRTFSSIYTQAELMTRLAEETKRTQSALLELKRTNQKLEHLATTDQLTGCGNRRQFVERIEIEISRSSRDNPTFSLLSLDIDHFKAINDTYGHLVGDEVLRGFAQTCREVVRPYDYVARVGGEEFMILLPETELKEAYEIGERLRWVVANGEFRTKNGPLKDITISIGATEFGRDGDTLEKFLRTADERLYRAKDRGRNCVIAA
ncbi:MAG TPA: GGDEF domain-containing protein [Pseudolabrys sp.]|jgi:two-component system cell cycle response regulator